MTSKIFVTYYSTLTQPLVTTTASDTDILGTAAGAIPFVSGTGAPLAESANFNWDNAHTRLQIGAVVPDAPLTVCANAGVAASLTGLNGGVAHLIGADSSNAQVYIDAYAGTTPTNSGSVQTRTIGGTHTTPAAVGAGQRIGAFFASGTFSATQTGTGGFFQFQTTEGWSSTARGTRFAVSMVRAGSTTFVETIGADPASGLSVLGTVLVDQNGVIHKRVFATLAALQAAVTTPVDGMCAIIQDALMPAFANTASGGGAISVPVYYDSTAHGGVWVVG